MIAPLLIGSAIVATGIYMDYKKGFYKAKELTPEERQLLKQKLNIDDSILDDSLTYKGSYFKGSSDILNECLKSINECQDYIQSRKKEMGLIV